MTKKCRICGYKFKSKDEIICPECFTARDEDISCNRYTDDLHTHAYGYDPANSQVDNSDNDIFEEFKKKDESFIAEQREDEAENPIPSSTYAKKEPKQTPPPQSNASFGNGQSSFTRTVFTTTQKNTYNNDKSTLRWTNGFDPENIKNFDQGYQRIDFRKKKSSNKGCLIFLILFIFMFVVPFISGIASLFDDSSKSSTANYDYDYDYHFSAPDISMPDISIPDFENPFTAKFTGTISPYNITLSRLYKQQAASNLDGLNNKYQTDDFVKLTDESYKGSMWMLVKFDLKLTPDLSDDSRYADIESVVITSYDSDGNEISTSKLISYTHEDENFFSECEFAASSYATLFKVSVNTDNESGEKEAAGIYAESYLFSTVYDEGGSIDDSN